jgi:hypothetical protein
MRGPRVVSFASAFKNFSRYFIRLPTKRDFGTLFALWGRWTERGREAAPHGPAREGRERAAQY